MRLCSWKKGVCRMPNLICDYRQKHLIWIIGLSFICREYWLSQLVQKERVERGKLLLKAKFSNSLKIHHTLFFCKLLNLNIHCKTALLVTLSSKRNYSLQYHIDSPAAMQSLFAVPKLQQNSSSFIMRSKACILFIFCSSHSSCPCVCCSPKLNPLLGIFNACRKLIDMRASADKNKQTKKPTYILYNINL